MRLERGERKTTKGKLGSTNKVLPSNRHLLMVYYALCSVWVLTVQKLKKIHGLFLGVHDQTRESDNYNRIWPVM